ncbi:MAG: Alkylation response protein AidB-like acyl-CoA dehydrogenase [Acidimicrobiales bacterium]|nr:Alkylation response protein AidB-like acyl-CoA dehydrogenase [Acidimicrobiales bacterium]
MDFTWTEREQTYRAELREYIAAHILPGWNHNDRELWDPRLKAVVKEFCKALGDDGWLTPHWPLEYGGLATSPWERVVVGEEMWGVGEPRGPQYMNVNWIAPAVMMAGTPEQKTKYLTPMAHGSVIWCQGFSEPDAGSDLASLKTRAVRDGDEYIISGQKTWTSYAHAAENIILLVRTNPDLEAHKGISILLVPMDLPGIEVRDIRTPFVTDLCHEVFFNDVRVPVSCLLGPENEGWSVVRHTLTEERLGINRYAYHEQALMEAMEETECVGRSLDDPGLLEQIGYGFAMFEAERSINYLAVQERIDDPHGVRPYASVWRAFGGGLAEYLLRDLLMELMGPEGLINETMADRDTELGTIGPIASGAYEIQLNIVARFCLGLPKHG